MKIGMLFAMRSEFSAMPGADSFPLLETVAEMPVYEVAPDILACIGGISKVNAAMATQVLCMKYGVDLVLNAGVAGCLTDLPLNALVVASDLVQHDVDTSAAGDPPGLVSTVNRISFPVWEPELCVELLAQAGFDAVLGRVATSDSFIDHDERIDYIRETFHPLLAEMEGCAAPQVFLRNGVKFVALKSVSDHMSAEEYADFAGALDAVGRAALALAKVLQSYSA